MKHLIGAALVSLSLTAVADEVIVHTISRHGDYNRDKVETTVVGEITYTTTYRAYNNQNWGLGYRTDDGYEVGAYWNSHYKPSVYFSKGWMLNPYLGGFLGVASGYSVIDRPIMPLAGLIVRVPLGEKIHLELTGVPPLGERVSGVVHMGFSYRL